MKEEIVSLGRITIIKLRNAILDKGVTDKDRMLLCTKDFDTLLEEHRDTYNEPMNKPFVFLGVPIGEETFKDLKAGELLIKRGVGAFNKSTETEDAIDLYYGFSAYRCGYCGGIVDQDCKVLKGEEREQMISAIKEQGNSIIELRHGDCCPQEYDS